MKVYLTVSKTDEELDRALGFTESDDPFTTDGKIPEFDPDETEKAIHVKFAQQRRPTSDEAGVAIADIECNPLFGEADYDPFAKSEAPAHQELEWEIPPEWEIRQWSPKIESPRNSPIKEEPLKIKNLSEENFDDHLDRLDKLVYSQLIDSSAQKHARQQEELRQGLEADFRTKLALQESPTSPEPPVTPNLPNAPKNIYPESYSIFQFLLLSVQQLLDQVVQIFQKQSSQKQGYFFIWKQHTAPPPASEIEMTTLKNSEEQNRNTPKR